MSLRFPRFSILYEYVKNLSGDQKQRVAIARAVVNQPQVILADEPTGALDTKTSLEIMKILKQLNGNGCTIMLITHNMDIAEMGDRIVHIRDGTIV
ncbi:MAG: ATP-binding cassette domain-containing protein [Actinomycetia bacterium]|nr:ATP-binding cassette domain-containing protein [Actinomycetes bacterium]